MDLYNLSKNQQALKVLGNIQLAALHIACMMKGTVSSGDRLVGIVYFTQISILLKTDE